MVRGIVVDENETPILGAAIYLIDFKSSSNINFTNTDSSGKFDIQATNNSFQELLIKVTGTTYPDQYWHPDGMAISAPDFPIKLDSVSVFTVKIKLESNPATSLATPSQLYGSIEGQVKENGIPIVGIDVQLIDISTLIPIETATTDQYGGYLFINVPAYKQHYLKAIPGNGVLDGYPQQYYAGMNSTLYPQVELSVPEFNTYFMGEFYVSEFPPDSNDMNDTTINNDSADAVLMVTLYDSTGTVILNSANIYANYKLYSRPENSNDSIMVMHIPSGHMFIEMDVMGYPHQFYSPDGNTESSQYWFDVSPGDTQYIDIKMTTNPINTDKNQSTVIAGTVVDANGNPIPFATVGLQRKDNFNEGYHMNIPNVWSEYQETTDSLGNFTFEYLWNGEYVAFAFAKDKNYIPQFYPYSTDPFNAEVFSIMDGNTDTIKVEFKLKRGSTLTGFVKNKDGGSVTDTTIKVELHQNYDESSTSSTNPNFSMSFETRIDNNGKFILKGIPAGNWHINAWDENSLWAMYQWYNEEIITDGVNPFSKFPELVMKAGGNIYGTYTFEIQDTNQYHYWNLGRLFPILENFNGYPQFTGHNEKDSMYSDTMINEDNYEPTPEEEALWTWINIWTDTIKGQYRSSAIYAGNMSFIFAPEPNFDIWEFSKSGSIIKESIRWSYIDGASTLSSSKIFNITEGSSQKFDMTMKKGGYTILGYISSEGGETFRQARQTDTSSITTDTSDYTGSKWFRVMAFIKEDGNLIKVAESFSADSNKFVLNGLVDGESYYLFMEADGYPWQWYTGLQDSTTSNPDSAKPYTFSSINYKPIELYMQRQPQDYEDWNDEWDDRPSEVKNLTFTTIGLKAIQLNWSPLPEEDNVVKYRIYRLRDTSMSALTDLFVWDSSHGGWEPADESNIMEKVDSAEVVDTFWIDTKVAPDSAYMYVVFGVNSKGEEGMALHDNPVLESYITTVKLSALKSSATMAIEKWQMISVPGIDNVTVTANTADTSSKLFVFYWDEEADSTGVYSKYQKTNTLSPTQGYWLYTTDPVSGEFAEDDIKKLYDQLGNIKVILKAGWNQISSPYPYPIYPSFTNEVMELHYYNSNTGGYDNPTYMEPWKGYWIYSEKADTFKISETPAKATTRRRSRLSSLKNWGISIALNGTKYSDQYNYIGTVKSRNSIESLEPPSAFGAPQLYILENDKKLSKCYKSSAASEQRWTIALSPSEEDMNIEFRDIQNIAEDVMIVWTDGNSIINLKENSTLSIPNHDNTLYGTIVATSNPNTIALFSGNFILKQNYPNPFRGVTNFEFTIPYSFENNGKIQNSDFAEVSLEIFNMAGRKVATVIKKEMKVGTHRTLWDSKNLSNGAYIARLKAGKFIKTVKLFKIQ